jgi:hypothetical protein
MSRNVKWATRSALAIAAVVAILGLAGCAGGTKPKAHASAEEAAAALVAAMESGDLTKMEAELGDPSGAILESGDAVADSTDRATFLAQYREKHTLVPDGDDRMTLQVGANDWPLPIPLVKRAKGWAFDGAGAAEEIAYRRVGRNELGAIAVCRGYVLAQNLYASEGRDGAPAGIYAQKLVSDEGRQNGLYWKAAEGEPASPVGPFVAQAAAEGYRAGGADHPPYHGYRYRPLFAQGPHAPGGARDYFMAGELVGGFALVAWPAEYGISGVMTFMVSRDGVVYEKDLGMDTDKVVAKIDAFDPDPSWSVVEEDSTAVAGGE